MITIREVAQGCFAGANPLGLKPKNEISSHTAMKNILIFLGKAIEARPPTALTAGDQSDLRVVIDYVSSLI